MDDLNKDTREKKDEYFVGIKGDYRKEKVAAQDRKKKQKEKKKLKDHH